jgi:hypothetical protein
LSATEPLLLLLLGRLPVYAAQASAFLLPARGFMQVPAPEKQAASNFPTMPKLPEIACRETRCGHRRPILRGADGGSGANQRRSGETGKTGRRHRSRCGAAEMAGASGHAAA